MSEIKRSDRPLRATSLSDRPIDNLLRIQRDARLRENIEDALRELGAPNRPVALAVLDLDRSAELRASGLQVKIGVLEEIVEMVSRHSPPDTLIVPLGTRDEFCVAFPLQQVHAPDREAESMVDGIRREIETATYEYGGATYRATVSCGVAIAPIDTSDLFDLVLLADAACRKAKTLGRNRTQRADSAFVHTLHAELPQVRWDQLVQLSLQAGEPVQRLVHRGIELVLQRHSGLERYCEGARALPFPGPARSLAVIGPPGAGKSTVCSALRQRYTAAASFAVRLRLESLRRARAPLARRIDKALSAGTRFIPDGLVRDMFVGFLEEQSDTTLLLLEGFPINETQAADAAAILRQHGRQVDGVIDLQASPETLRRRIGARQVCRSCERSSGAGAAYPLSANECPVCGSQLERRSDDSHDHVAARIGEYHRQRSSIIECLGSVNISTIVVDGMPVEAVLEACLDAVFA